MVSLWVPAATPGDETTTCGPSYQVKWFNPREAEDPPVEAWLVVTTPEGEEILRVTSEAWCPHTIAPLWCEDILKIGTHSLAYTIYSGGVHCCWDAYVVLLERPSRVLLKASLGNYFDLRPDQLDDTGPLELVSRSDLFAVFAGLPSFAAPFLPLVFVYNGESYVEATVRFPDYIRADLEDALLDLPGGRLEEKRGKALRAFGDYVLLGQDQWGLSDLKTRVSADVAEWLDNSAVEAIERIRHRYRFRSDKLDHWKSDPRPQAGW